MWYVLGWRIRLREHERVPKKSWSCCFGHYEFTPISKMVGGGRDSDAMLVLPNVSNAATPTN